MNNEIYVILGSFVFAGVLVYAISTNPNVSNLHIKLSLKEGFEFDCNYQNGF